MKHEQYVARRFSAAIVIAGLKSCATQYFLWRPKYVAQGFRPADRACLCVFVFSWLVLGVGITAQTPSPNWPQFRGNPRLTGVAPTAPPDTLRLKWTYDTGDSIE